MVKKRIREEICMPIRKITYVERKLKAEGFEPELVSEEKNQTIVLRIKGFEFPFVCTCPLYPEYMLLNCPLHRRKDSWFPGHPERIPDHSEQITDVLNVLKAAVPT